MATTPADNRKVEYLQSNAGCDNKVVTAHYTFANFIPKNLMEQYTKPANLYFLFILILQSIPAVSQTDGVPTTAPAVLFVCLLNMLKDGFEDWRRHKSDTTENEAVGKVLKTEGGKAEDTKWADIRIGNVLVVRANEVVPADMVILTSCHEEGHCFIETCQLDGETSLKMKQAPTTVFQMLGKQAPSMEEAVHRAGAMSGYVECEGPNEYLYTFVGTANFKADANTEKISLDEQHIILRGCKVKNVPWVLGMVVYTGHQTKIMMNSQGKEGRKVSHLDMNLGKLTFAVFIIQCLFCIIAAILGAVHDTSKENLDRTYLNLGDENGNPKNSFGEIVVVRFFNFILLLTNFIPISLLVSVSVCKALQVGFFVYDEEMIHDGVPCTPRTADLNDELGQVEYVFSDKTGTLTCNVMDFRQFCVGGVMYGEGMTEIKRSVMIKMGKQVPPQPTLPPGVKRTPHVDLVDHKLDELLNKRQGSQYEALKMFFTHLAVNHEVFVEQDGEGQLQFSASSPDEAALCYGAHHFGYSFRSREPQGVHVELADGGLLKVQIRAILKFNSTRKRSSVVVKYEEKSADGMGVVTRHMLFCKGADTVIMARLTPEQQRAQQTLKTRDNLKEMAEDGLRTLCLAGRELTEQEADAWLKTFHDASCATEGRAEKLDDCYDMIEKDLKLQGVTGIEDRLQDGVGDAITNMTQAGIKVWMLTGDMYETAVNIGIATGLLQAKLGKDNVRPVFRKDDFEREGVFSHEEASRKFREVGQAARQAALIGEHFEAMVIDGKCLDMALDAANESDFVDICRVCSTVVACRVSPKQKGAVVRLIKAKERVVTLAIGDGANDCNMIQSADVGIGIRGLEGLQAFNVCDYGIAQFRFLQTLLLVHGRWCYRRIAVLVNYTFYKNFVVVLPQFFFGFVSGFSGQKLYNDVHYQMYNVTLSMAPICFFALFDQDVSRKACYRWPELYQLGIRCEYLNPRTSGTWIACGVWHALVIFLIPYFTMSNGNITHSDGKANDIWLVGTVMFACVLLVVNLVVVLETFLMNWITAFGLFLSFLSWFVLQVMEIEAAFVGSTMRLFSCPMLWLVMITTTCMALMLDVEIKGVRCSFFPNELHKVQALLLGPNVNEPPRGVGKER